MEHAPDPIHQGLSEPPTSSLAPSSLRLAASTSRTCGRYAVGPTGRSRTPDAYRGAPTDPHKKIQTTKNEVDRPRPFQG
jgi:hypothetical protein